jgi:hypothetical protein
MDLPPEGHNMARLAGVYNPTVTFLPSFGDILPGAGALFSSLSKI